MQTIVGKPLGRKAYGSIGHLPGSRRGPGDHGISEGQARIATSKARDKHDFIVVQEKLDGSNVCVANIGGVIMPLTRAGYHANSSPYPQHHLFARWVALEAARFDWLPEGYRVCGEWLAQAHGTRYALKHEPFVAFDLMIEDRRLTFAEFQRLVPACVPCATTIHVGGPLSTARAVELLGDHGHHGAIDKTEGAVWRVERKDCVDFLCKYVRPDKVDGLYLPEISGKGPVWNWQP